MAPPSTRPLPASEVETADRLAGVAAPVLIGFGAALVGLIVSNPGHMRWPDAAAFVLIVSDLALVVSMQLYLKARGNLVTEAEVAELVPLGTEEHRRLTKGVQDETFRRWAARSQFFFNFGLSSLFLALAGVLVPPGPICDQNAFRLLAVAVAGLGCVLNAVWAAREQRQARLAETAQRDLEAATEALSPPAPPA